MVEAGELMRPERCHRVWLGASDVEEEGVWRDSETGDILDIEEFWGPGQPNGVRVQNCAGIWELVSKRLIEDLINQVVFSRMVREVIDMMMVDVRLNLNVSFAISNFILELP